MTLRRNAKWAEVLAAVCVVGVMAAIFFPSICACTKESSKVSHCMSNLKSLAYGHLMYAAEDSGERFASAETWMDAIGSYTKSTGQFQCPIVVQKRPRDYGYAFHSALSRRPLESVQKPEKAALVYDSTQGGRNAADRMESLPQPGRHSGGRNVIAYADAHAKAEWDRSKLVP